MKKLITILSVLLLFTDCEESDSKNSSLSKDSAKELIENTLISLEKYPDNGYENYFNEAIITAPEFNTLMPQLIQEWNLNNPGNVKINEVKNGAAEKNNQKVAQVVGTFQCEGSDHVSDFNFTFIYDESSGKWEIIDFKFEGC
jgi:hypothetical protein